MRIIGYKGLAAIVIGVAFAVYLVGGGSVHLWDRDEAWYAQTSKQMVESGDWLVPRFLDAERYSKPVLVYWLQAAAMKVLGTTPRAARLPSAIAMTLTLILLAAALWRRVGPRRTLYTIAIFGSSAMVMASAKMCLTDAVLLLFLTGAQLSLFAIYRGAGWRAALLMWACIGMAGLTKGPIVLVVLLGTMAVLAILDWRMAGGGRRNLKPSIRWWWRTKPWIGLIVVPAIVAPWLIALYLKAPDFLREMLREPFRHAGSNQDGQSAWPGYYLAVIWPTFFPWSILLIAALVIGWRRRGSAAVRFCLSTILGNWLFHELMVTKLPHYLLPSYASLAYLTACALIDVSRGRHRRLFGRCVALASLVWAPLAFVLSVAPAAPIYDAGWFEIPRAAAGAFAVVAWAYIMLVLLLLLNRKAGWAATVMFAGMMTLIAILYGWYLPRAQFLRLPMHVAADLRGRGATVKGEVAMAGYTEPSLAFYQGGTIRGLPAEFMTTLPRGQWPGTLVTTDRWLAKQPEALRGQWEELSRFRGLNYNGMARSDLHWRVREIAAGEAADYKSPLRIENVLVLKKK